MKNLPLSLLLALFALHIPACQTQEQMVLISAEEAATQTPAQLVSKSTRSAATELLAALNDEQKKLAVHDIKAPLRKDWHFIPRQHQGLMLGDMSAQQKSLVHQLMQTALSDSGYLKATDIIWLETVLYEMSNKNPMRDPGKYALQIFGDPTNEQAAWGWRLEGHHLSINLTYTLEGIGVTPLFFGTNPAVVQEGPLAGKRVLADAHYLALKFMKSLHETQQERATLASKPKDVMTLPGREVSLRQPAGIPYSELTEDQILLLTDLIFANQGDLLQDDHYQLKAADWFEPRGKNDLLEIHFAWAGPVDADKPFYYRIHSPRFVIEYSCQGRNHVHTVIHDLTDPLQEDLLKKHFEQHEH